ncbi:MAG TPA: DUF6677 family protein [Bryobacteraceae bacterium]|nr:DUF6677 family protein [Bryobacteraceae bacterium]
MPATTAAESVPAPLRSPITTCIIAWLVPGAGHFFVGRKGRAAIVFATVAACFGVGLLMNGPFFAPTSGGDLLSRLIQYGGFIGDLANGLFYLLASWLGYGPPQSAGHNADYGSKFLVCAGLLNILAMVDAYEIATRQKE